ncbi:DUF441 domain-containing protein [Paenibacillus albiflavus]|uniref:UPF0756 membrane protein E0485_10310 n=1 Tax=Paenibacillus albiflavus TaxID=2545760 RepID=A0A4R4EBT9_9BACL|nr:DUF441 domain-containing protein [Paenibacillus albiflavus]TCZ77384.1 DUF441 domain-containing protein [Paenibacillus albiflavus]
MANVDASALILLLFAGLGVISNNMTVSIAMIILLFLRVTNLHQTFPWLEKYGVTVGIIILTIGVMTPIASGRISLQSVLQSFIHWKSLLAIGIGVLVSYLGGRGVTLMGNDPSIISGLLIGTLIGVAVFRGVPVGPLIAAGILSMLIGVGK